MARKIVITSGKGGVGKTTLTANLGIALSELNKKVLLVDVDFGLNNLDVVLGVENKIVYDILDVTENKCRPIQAVIKDFLHENLYCLPSNHTYVAPIPNEKLKEIIESLDGDFDYILIDCPAGIDQGFVRAIMCADEAIIVTTPHLTAVRDGDKVLSVLNNFDITNVTLVINRARGDLIENGEMISVNTISEYLDIELLGVIPEDDNITCQLLYGGQVKSSSDAFVAFKMLANKIEGISGDIYDCTKKYKGIWGNIKRKIKKIV